MTTVVALLPMAFGLQGSSKSYGPFASSIAFGLIFAMIGTLFVIPLSYASANTAEKRFRELAGRFSKSFQRSPGADESRPPSVTPT
jgi:hypothetical protein